MNNYLKGMIKISYNSYRHRNYNISKNKARSYAKQMNDLETIFKTKYPEWSLSTMKDSCYYDNDNFEIRISNHSAEYKHNIQDGYLIVNIKSSKLDFPKIIDNIVPKVIAILNNKDLSQFRFINVINNRIDCYFKNFKTKKISFFIK